MQRHTLIALLALSATLMLAAISASIAQAEEAGVPLVYLPSGRNPTAREPATFSAESQTQTNPILETARSRIECEKDTADGELTSGRHGTATITFTGCKALGVSCGSLGDAVGTILDGGAVTAVDLEIGGKLVLGMEANLSGTGTSLHIECPAAGVLIEIRGALIGVSVGLPEPTAGTVTLLLVETTRHYEGLDEKGSRAGEQKQKKCNLPKETCEGKTYNLEVTFGRKFEEAALVTEQLAKFPASYLVEY
jgi:hypothetical protein